MTTLTFNGNQRAKDWCFLQLTNYMRGRYYWHGLAESLEMSESDACSLLGLTPWMYAFQDAVSQSLLKPDRHFWALKFVCCLPVGVDTSKVDTIMANYIAERLDELTAITPSESKTRARQKAAVRGCFEVCRSLGNMELAKYYMGSGRRELRRDCAQKLLLELSAL